MIRANLNELHFESHKRDSNLKRKKYKIGAGDKSASKTRRPQSKLIRAANRKERTRKTEDNIYVTIPSDTVKELDIAPRDNIIRRNNKAGYIFIKKEKMTPKESDVSEEFLKTLDEGMTKYHQTLENLIER